MKKHINLSSLSAYIFLSICSLFVLMPFLWVVVSSLKTKDDFIMNPMGMPESYHFDNYLKAFTSINMPVLLKNSAFISVTSVIVCLLLVSMASFVLARFTLKANKFLYSYFLLGLMIPINAAIIPLFLLMRDLQLINSYTGVIIPYITFQIPIGIFLLTNYMKTIPQELEEAAVIDGCGVLRLFTKIIFPLSRPIFATFSIISFISVWNEFTFSLVFLSGAEMQTIPLGLASFRGQFDTDTTVMLAGTVIAIIPTIIIFALLKRQIMQGMTAGAVKG